jgi:glucokinase
LVSGSALSAIYESKTNLKISSEEVFEKFNAKDHVANKVIDGFIKSLAETLSDLALTFLPGDEILLAGSLMRSLFPIINGNDFTEAFISTKNGIHKELLEKISIGVIMKEKTPLYGNFNLFKNLN